MRNPRPRTHSPRRVATASLLTAALAVGATGCGKHADPTALPGDFTNNGEGSLVSANVLPNVATDITDNSSLAARYTYVSTSGVNNHPLNVSGTLLLPRGVSSSEGWKIVAVAHPMTGIQRGCAPSSSNDLFGLVPTVVPLLQAGYAVTVPDYQGLGTAVERHPFLDSTTVGRNLIDSVRAAAKFAHTSNSWVAIGTGQGGQASWAANELMSEDGAGLELKASLSVEPWANLEGLADAAAAGTLTTEQKLVLVQYLAGLKAQFDEFDLDQYRRGGAAKDWDALLTCDTAQRKNNLIDQVSADDLRPATPAATDALRNYLRKTTLPQGKAAAPIRVSYTDSDPIALAAWTSQALTKACRFDDTIEIDHDSQPNPANVDMPTVVKWIDDRMNNVPPANDCPGLAAAEPQ
ncbi:MAG: lipase family protein [Mycobacterium sp.]